MALKKKTVLLFSGGLDSTTMLYLALSEGREVLCLCIDYGQRHRKELSHARAIAAKLGIQSLVLRVPIDQIANRSALTNPLVELPQGEYATGVMKTTVVPGRNLIFLSLAAAVAKSRGFDSVGIAAHAGDHEIYEDCRPEFLESCESPMGVGLWSPFCFLTKAEIVALARLLDVPIGDTWSCYAGGETPCYKCGTCLEREAALK